MDFFFLVVSKHVFRVGNGDLDHHVRRSTKVESIGSVHRAQPSTLPQNGCPWRILLDGDERVVCTVGFNL